MQDGQGEGSVGSFLFLVPESTQSWAGALLLERGRLQAAVGTWKSWSRLSAACRVENRRTFIWLLPSALLPVPPRCRTSQQSRQEHGEVAFSGLPQATFPSQERQKLGELRRQATHACGRAASVPGLLPQSSKGQTARRFLRGLAVHTCVRMSVTVFRHLIHQ